MYRQLSPDTYPKTIYISPELSYQQAKELFVTSGFNYPFAVKPDVGMMGYLFRKMDNDEEFRKYHEKMPVEYIIQELIDYPIEVSVFYYRFPNQQKGRISGFLKKQALQVTGDGASTLEQLIENHPKARFRIDEMRSKHKNNLQKIVPAGKIYPLSWAANLSRGAKLISLAHETDERLQKVFDNLSSYTKYFYYGRYDIKCASIEDLKEGRNFSILEYNGAGAEPHHIYGAGLTLLQAYREVLHHWNVLYKISKYNNANGIRYWKFRDGWNFFKAARKHFSLLKKLDTESV